MVRSLTDIKQFNSNISSSSLANKLQNLKPDYKAMQQIKYQEKQREKIAKQMRSPKHPDIILSEMKYNLEKIRGIQEIRE